MLHDKTFAHAGKPEDTARSCSVCYQITWDLSSYLQCNCRPVGITQEPGALPSVCVCLCDDYPTICKSKKYAHEQFEEENTELSASHSTLDLRKQRFTDFQYLLTIWLQIFTTKQFLLQPQAVALQLSS